MTRLVKPDNRQTYENVYELRPTCGGMHVSEIMSDVVVIFLFLQEKLIDGYFTKQQYYEYTSSTSSVLCFAGRFARKLFVLALLLLTFIELSSCRTVCRRGPRHENKTKSSG